MRAKEKRTKHERKTLSLKIIKMIKTFFKNVCAVHGAEILQFKVES